jgi:hypothetical protein
MAITVSAMRVIIWYKESSFETGLMPMTLAITGNTKRQSTEYSIHYLSCLLLCGARIYCPCASILVCSNVVHIFEIEVNYARTQNC